MRIELAGFNVEAEILQKLNLAHDEILTPEIFSSAYARISRSSKDITALRRQARKDIERARKSNQTIIFDMGHHSVAEHAVFNFDIIGVSRLALEEIEQLRLASYTEKSQRYVTLEGDYVLPAEIEDTQSQALFKETVFLQNEFYKKSFALLEDYHAEICPEKTQDKGSRKDLQNLAKEDARYILSLASEGQLGLTINARNLEHLFRKSRLSKRSEVREIGKRMFDLVYRTAPSLILFPQPSNFEKELKDSFKNNFAIEKEAEVINLEPEIVQYSETGDDIILALFLAGHNSLDYKEAYHIVSRMKSGDKEKIFKDLFKNMEFFDSPPREFEFADITFQAVITASHFAQLKRHRLASLICGEYNIGFGNTIPESIKGSGLEEEFREIIEKTNQTYVKLKERYSGAADYLLTNSHRRLVIMKMNLRELYHFIRLREDEHAQWEIRSLARKLLRKVRAIMPYSTMLLCGKSNFVSEFERIYGKKPGYII